MNEFSRKYRGLFLALFIIAIIAATGCTGSKNSTSPVQQLADEEIEPNNPTWKIDEPYLIKKVSEKLYQVTLHWNQVTTNKNGQANKIVAGYYVFRGQEGGSPDVKIATTTDDNYIDKSSELVEGKKFVYTVVAFDNMLRESPRSGPQVIMLQPAAGKVPKSPENIYFAPAMQSVFGSDHGSIIVSWDQPTQNTDGSALDNLLEFEIERHTENVKEWQSIAKVPAAINVFSDSNLVMGSYYYRIRATNKLRNYSQYVDGSYTLTGKSDNVSPGIPTGLDASGDAQILLTWVKPDRDSDMHKLDIAGFKIYRKKLDAKEDYELVKVIPADIMCTDNNVNRNEYYQYVVSAFDNSGNESGMSKPASNKSKIEFPETPNNVYANVRKVGGDVSLKWDAVPGAASYKVYRSEISDGFYELVGQPTLTEFTNSMLMNKTFYYKVSAVDSMKREGSMTSYVTVSGDATYTSLEAESFIQDIRSDLNTCIAYPALFKLEARALQYPADSSSLLFFGPIDDERGEVASQFPVPNQAPRAVGDWFEISAYAPYVTDTSGFFVNYTTPYNIDIWALCSSDSGIYSIVVNGTVMGSFDFFTSGPATLSPYRIIVNASNTTSEFKIAFICQGKNAYSKNYNLYLDKFVMTRVKKVGSEQ